MQQSDIDKQLSDIKILLSPSEKALASKIHYSFINFVYRVYR